MLSFVHVVTHQPSCGVRLHCDIPSEEGVDRVQSKECAADAITEAQTDALRYTVSLAFEEGLPLSLQACVGQVIRRGCGLIIPQLCVLVQKDVSLVLSERLPVRL